LENAKSAGAISLYGISALSLYRSLETMRKHTELYFGFMRSGVDLCHQKPPRYCPVTLGETVVS
jgi:hypothetical protein